MKAVVKLPPRQQNRFEAPQCLVGHELYFEDPDHKVTDYNLRYVLQDYSLLEIKREHHGGFLSFPDPQTAERVYSLYNGYVFNNNATLKFKLSYSDLDDPQPQGPVLEVNHLPTHINHNTLYDIFRPFGPLSICKSITEQGAHRGKALIQYFEKEDSNSAQEQLDNKYYGGNPISITVFMPTVPKPTYNTPSENSYVDYLNLYVKNLDGQVDNNELFGLFRKFGRIVSARVMTHPGTGQSKGYGFVSYNSPEESLFAMEQMNGFNLRGKPLVVNYHETKKPRQEKSTSTTTSSFHSPPAVEYLHTSYDSYQATKEYIETTDPLSIRELSVGAIPIKPMPEPKFSPPTSNRPSLASLASGATIQMPPLQESNNKVVNEYDGGVPRRSLRRRGSLESISSVMTETSAQVQRQKMTEAVKAIRKDFDENRVNDVVDMLLTLKKKERSLCLFNPDFLKEKIDIALEALEICDDDVLEEDDEDIRDKVKGTSLPTSFLNFKPFVPSGRINNFSPPKDVVIPPRVSKAIPIVAPVIIPDKPTSGMKALFESFKGKPIHEQKQLLGDRLFPLVKETGIRQAPKVTIRLLDTIPLEELAGLMCLKEELKKRVESAYSSLNSTTTPTTTTTTTPTTTTV